jgi:hypothetical protein
MKSTFFVGFALALGGVVAGAGELQKQGTGYSPQYTSSLEQEFIYLSASRAMEQVLVKMAEERSQALDPAQITVDSDFRSMKALKSAFLNLASVRAQIFCGQIEANARRKACSDELESRHRSLLEEVNALRATDRAPANASPAKANSFSLFKGTRNRHVALFSAKLGEALGASPKDEPPPPLVGISFVWDDKSGLELPQLSGLPSDLPNR